MEKQNFYAHEQFSEHMYVITESYSMVHRFSIGCVVGSEKVLVIDSGLGMTSDLRNYVEGIAGKDHPIICACTHGHLDHVGSACLFDEAYCSHLDFAHGEDPFDPIRRYCDLVDFSLESNIVSDYGKEHMIRNNHVDFKDIRDGDVFDLGDIQVEAIAVPGHSAGSMAFYCREENWCFTGDAINTDTHLSRLNRTGFAAYKKTMENFISRVDEKTTIFPCHLPLPMTIQAARNLLLIADELARGENLEKDPPCNGIFHGRQNNPDIRGHYINNTCIVYNRSLVAEPGQKFDKYDCCYYSHEKWSDRVYTVTINYSTVNRITLMVFVGDEKILVIDSGHGIDDRLPAYIRKMTGSTLPMIQACTHVGIDHVGGAILFDEVYLHENDIKKLPLAKNKRYIDAQPFSNYSQEFAEYSLEFMLDPVQPEDCRKIEDGDVFHLGGLDVECIFTPGHSTGHMAFYCESEKVAFTGDAMNTDTHLKALEGASFPEYAAMLDRFLVRIRPDTDLFSSHMNRPNGMRVPLNIREACLEISRGETEGDPQGEAIQQHIGAFHNPDIKMHFHGICCVVYNRSLL